MSGGKSENLVRGGIYLAKLDPTRGAEVGKIRPVIVLMSQTILNVDPPIVFICPLSSRSYPEFKSLHIELSPRDSLQTTSYALIEHCRAIATSRLVQPRLAQLTAQELTVLTRRLSYLIG